MASDQSFVIYICDQVGIVGQISFRKMFGEYLIYCHGKVVALVCDNQLFVKPTLGGKAARHLYGSVTLSWRQTALLSNRQTRRQRLAVLAHRDDSA